LVTGQPEQDDADGDRAASGAVLGKPSLDVAQPFGLQVRS